MINIFLRFCTDSQSWYWDSCTVLFSFLFLTYVLHSLCEKSFNKIMNCAWFAHLSFCDQALFSVSFSLVLIKTFRCRFSATCPQRSNAVRVRNMTRFHACELQGSSKTDSKSQMLKLLLERVSICLPLILSPHTLFCHCISTIAFLRTSLRKRFELIQIFKALALGCKM